MADAENSMCWCFQKFSISGGDQQMTQRILGYQGRALTPSVRVERVAGSVCSAVSARLSWKVDRCRSHMNPSQAFVTA